MPSLDQDDDCPVVELRQYTLHPGQRDALIDLFDREFIEPQEACGIRVMGQFRDVDDADRFVWLRGFRDMPGRANALGAFYGGPAWQAHRGAANATMVDSDNVLLLRPAWPGAGVRMQRRPHAPAPSPSVPRGLVTATLFQLDHTAPAELLDECRRVIAPRWVAAGIALLGWYATDPTPNNFPRLAVREGESVLACFTVGEPATLGAAPWAQRMDTLRLAPTTRSAIRGG